MTARERRGFESFITKTIIRLRRDLKRLRDGDNFNNAKTKNKYFYVMDNRQKVVAVVDGLDHDTLVNALEGATWPTKVRKR